ncbi:MAG: ribose transporter substrate-binding protein [Naasia sp.]|jgi:D-xylose transport system substrate-binding protein|uniref:substrate-binding domain-containing protein n=1 Tax=Naasia sp. TaxID=2546198 RepID=UPI00262CB0D6|nr:substrate-binding domain-containing protein [Naasia sp.]MCU1571145.1 ribose transporter substrate-binding protein [Naasia sp.]
MMRAGVMAVTTGMLMTGLAACATGDNGDAASGGGAPDGESFVIGISVKNQTQRRWEFDVAAMKARLEALGDTVLIEYSNDDQVTQNAGIENLITKGIDALIITPVDDAAAAQAVKSANQAQIPVIAYDIGVKDAPIDFFVQRDNPLAGKLQMEAAVAAAPEGNYAFLRGDAGTGVVKIISGQWDLGLKGNAKIKVVSDQFIPGFDIAAAQANAENVLSAQNDDVAAFLVLNDGMASGVAQAIAGRHLTGKVFLSGLDADESALALIADGRQSVTIWTPLDEQGVLAADAAHALAAGEKPKSQSTEDFGNGAVPTALVSPVAITQDNLCEWLNGKFPEGWADKETVLKGNPTLCD